MFPIFILILMGYLSVSMGLTNSDQIKALGTFVMKVSLPATMLYALLQDKSSDDSWVTSYVFVYGIASLSIFFLAYYFFKKRFMQRSASAIVLSLGATISNTGLVGVAILPLLIGQEAMYYLALTILFESIILTSLILFLAESGSYESMQFSNLFKKTVQHIFHNPLVVAILLGLLCVSFDFDLPKLLLEPLAWLSQVSMPLALFVMGGTLSNLRLRWVDRQSVLLAIFKTMLLPTLVFLLFKALPEVDQSIVHIAVFIAMLPMPSLFMSLGQIYGIEKRTHNAFILSHMFTLLGMSTFVYYWY